MARKPKEEKHAKNQNSDIQEEAQIAETAEISETEEPMAEVVSEADQLKKQLSDYVDKLQRLGAEFDNFRKRTQKEKAARYDDGVKDTFEKILPVIDNFERAIASSEGKDENDPLYKGVVMIYKIFIDILAGNDVKEIPALNQKFDANIHFAVAHTDDESYGENEIVEVMQKGYMYKDKIIRYSMVKVAN